MDLVENEDIMEDLNSSIEEMDIDEKENDERSKLWDKKIQKKEQKILEDDLIYENKKKSMLAKNEMNEERKRKQLKREKKNRKQKKQKTKQLDVNDDNIQNKQVNTVLNIKPVPKNCIHLVNEGDLVYVVPGNGACGPNCAAAHLFHDEIFGPALRLNMNKFQADHWEEKYKSITNCSTDKPYIRKSKGGEVKFTDPAELLKFLRKKSDKGAYMWTECEDLVVLSDMYQLSIKIITMKGESDKNPSVNSINPDKEMEKYAEIKNLENNEMVLLHEDETHFNLIVSKTSDLATQGSLSYRFSLNKPEPKETQDEELDEDNSDCEIVEEESIDDTNELKKELKKSYARNKVIEKQYILCEKELRKKTEEAEKLKSEVKDLTELLKLQKQLDDVENGHTNEENTDALKDEEFIVKMKSSGFKRSNPQSIPSPNKDRQEGEGVNVKVTEGNYCTKCNYKGKNRVELSKHIRLKHTNNEPTPTSNADTIQFNCMDCYYQGTTQLGLSKHIHLKHEFKNMIKCRNCDKSFTIKSDLMVHRKSAHKHTVALCRNYPARKCNFSADECWWNHAEGEDKTIECYFCDKSFQNRTQVMMHRKKEHRKTVKPCTKDVESNCSYEKDLCWFLHKEENVSFSKTENEATNNSFFWQVPNHPEPPLDNPKMEGRRKESQNC